ncbi:hypothetical protein [Parachitinimonas caeni]|uniref:Uncharacterized protein n=1 Tax=Parachitinimonas caeni TaxID=3031301 RepID=A0ABT7DYJ7_9NEIS|nr:hypothetical protein [Parachitinimonas caeni]MDK2125084.1 hypothetical protein [Parachitinimonas caeni]
MFAGCRVTDVLKVVWQTVSMLLLTILAVSYGVMGLLVLAGAAGGNGIAGGLVLLAACGLCLWGLFCIAHRVSAKMPPMWTEHSGAAGKPDSMR